ncbi:MAG TPA: NACHT domain-containing protein [Actinophytocola sp.]|uniref:NACHT domain-containing protein n=1 Tax=Actinophytocola sp. TaxID=1872138 RepID=UPI002DB6A8B0|nr:NACHT domain-containing protein [Actinophytocola sp.]HEU5471303.1 NACHT domain-containing protein [Actinophytocola sp.]
MADLLRAQVQAGSELPYRLPGARKPSLATVYVRQELGTGVETAQPEQPRTEPSRDGKVPASLPEPPTVRLAVRPPARTVRSVLDADDHLLITGGPGQGKSTLSLRQAADIAAAWESRPDEGDAPLAEPVVPLRLTAPGLAACLAFPFAQALAQCVHNEYGSLLRTSVDAAVFAERVAGRRWLLLVDGLDEVANTADRDRLVTVLATRASDPAASAYRVVLTTRPVPGEALAPLHRAGAARYELQPFDEAALRTFAGSWFAADEPGTADQFLHQIRRAHLDDLVRVPLLATIAAIIFTEYRDRPLPDNQYQLYETYLDYLRASRPAGGPFDPLRTALLEHLGRIRLSSDASLLITAFDWYANRIPPEHRPPNWRDELVSLLSSAGPLTMRADQLRFLHHSFAEHLAATSTARDLPPEFSADHATFTHLLHTARDKDAGRFPRAVLLHYTRLHPDQADRLIRSLHAGIPRDHVLAARLLAKRAPASTEVFDEFLATAQSWALTTTYPSGEILANVTRATHHPGLVSWLAELSNDERAPWQSRIKAAIALATRQDDGRATDLLQIVVNDATLAVSDRLDAAEGLAECGVSRREEARRGLRLLLADPATPAMRRRSASVVLARLGADARAEAVESLLTTLDDPWTPWSQLVEAAIALAEIGLEFHNRCTKVLRSVLHARGAGTVKRNAALGLAALGPRHAQEAADALTAIARDRTQRYFRRTEAAETLRELGSQFGIAAVDLVHEMLAEPSADLDERTRYASTLARLGSAHHADAAVHLMAMYETARIRADWDSDITHGLVELGPEYQADCAQALLQVADDPLNDGWVRNWTLGKVATLGQTHRNHAVDRLLEQVRNHGLEPGARIQAAAELNRLGPEFHREIEDFLLQVVNRAAPEQPRIFTACYRLSNAGTQHHDNVTRVLARILRSVTVDSTVLTQAAADLVQRGPERRKMAGAFLISVLTDPARPDQHRIAAGNALAGLGGEYDRQATAGLLDLLRHDVVDLPPNYAWDAFSGMGIEARTKLAAALLRHFSHPHAGPRRTVELASVISALSDDHAAEAIAVLEAVLTDDTATPGPRFDAACALTGLRPDRRVAVVAATLRCVEPVNIFWTMRRAGWTLAKLGHDATPMVRSVLASLDAERELRQRAAELLPQLKPDLIGDAVAELRGQIRDEHLDEHTRSEIMMSLVELDPEAAAAAVALLEHLLADDEQPVPVRCDAAARLVRLDRGRWSDAVARVRGWLADPYGTSGDQLALIQCVDTLKATGADEGLHAVRALIRDPALDPSDRRQAIDLLRGRMRLDAQRVQLADHQAGIGNRMPAAQGYRESPPLRVETERAIRDVLIAPEFGPRERISAAVALAELSFRLLPEAVAILIKIAETDAPIRFTALTELAWLDSPARRDALSRTEALVVDDSLPARYRRLAAETLMVIEYRTNRVAVDFLREVGADPTLAGRCRVSARYLLRHVDGPGPLRALRNDALLPMPVRLDAAAKLVAFAAGDRAVAARMSGQVAEDGESRPALRLRALETLAKLGRPGRRRAIDVLTGMMRTATLPATIRIRSARQLGEICPARRPEVIDVLHEIGSMAEPLQRVAALSAIGRLNPEEATPLLGAMADDRSVGAVVRLRAAEGLAKLRSDQREPASVVARELMGDEGVAWHVRRRAACDLARWSLVCREEARDMIIKLDGGRG